MRDVAEGVDGGDDSRLGLLADIVEPVEHAGYRSHRNLRLARNVADGRFCHGLPRPICAIKTAITTDCKWFVARPCNRLHRASSGPFRLTAARSATHSRGAMLDMRIS